jgi:hypothetical protein
VVLAYKPEKEAYTSSDNQTLNYHGQPTTEMLWFKALGQVHNPCKYYIWRNFWLEKVYEQLDGAKLTGKCIMALSTYPAARIQMHV